GCFRSHSGRRLRTGGILVKLLGFGGEDVAHSSVQASHGSSPASGCFFRVIHRFHRKTSTAMAIIKAPAVEIKFRVPKPGKPGEVNSRRGMPIRPKKCCTKSVRLKPITKSRNISVPHWSERNRPLILGNQ